MNHLHGLETNEDPYKRHQLTLLRLLWAGLLLGVVAFAVVVIVKVSGGRSPGGHDHPPGDDPVLFYTSLVLFITMLPTGLSVRSQVYKRYWVGHRVSPEGYYTGNIIFFAICEVITFVSLIVVLTSRSFLPQVIPATVTVAVMLLNFPHGRPMQPDEMYFYDTDVR